MNIFFSFPYILTPRIFDFSIRTHLVFSNDLQQVLGTSR